MTLYESSWKSGASAPRGGHLIWSGSRPRAQQGLKAFASPIRNAALKGPLFHGCIRPGSIKQGSARSISRTLAIWVIVGLLAVWADGQVTFERLVNSAKEPQNWMTYSGDYTGSAYADFLLDLLRAKGRGQADRGRWGPRLWQHLPVPIATVLGPNIVKYIP